MPTRRFLIALVLAVMVPVMVPSPGPAVAQDMAAEAEDFIRGLGQEAIDSLARPDLSRDQRIDRFRDLLQRGFNTDYIARFVVGRYWNQMTDEQRREYRSLFRDLIVSVYAERFDDYSGEDLRINGVRVTDNGDAIVSTTIVRPGAENVVVDWRVRRFDEGLQIIDVVVEGVSQGVTQRQEFANVIQRGGGRPEALLDALRNRVND